MTAKESAQTAKAATPAKRPKGSKVKRERKDGRGMKALRSFGGYFKGAWQELRQVRWPDRGATWGLTLAVILFAAFFAAIILGLDAAFSYLFKEILL